MEYLCVGTNISLNVSVGLGAVFLCKGPGGRDRVWHVPGDRAGHGCIVNEEEASSLLIFDLL